MPLFQHLADALATVAPPVDVAILQPADPFLETAGEDMRRRIFITQSGFGEGLCLRPEFTIPICMDFVGNGNELRRCSYGGTVFRQSREGASEFRQVGMEDLGRDDATAADADALRDMLVALDGVGRAADEVELGDQALFAVVVDGLGLPAGVGDRLLRSFGAPKQLAALLDRLSEGTAARDDREEDRLACAGDAVALEALVRERMDVANLSPKAGRSPKDIAARMIERSAIAGFSLAAEQLSVLRNFLDLRCPLDETKDRLTEFGAQNDLDFGTALDAFVERAAHLGDTGSTALTYRASLGRNLGYYTGMVFEASRKGVLIGGGGRYDGLCSLLGAPATVPAVGFSIAIDRLEDAA
ncbi:MAG: ATP phosphoribosyltransferase regulatory subunit [Pseudomonadota bacterium]